jgi:large subunit ribosomal protein L13
MKTIFVKPKDIERKWWLVDAEGQTLGRLASRITMVLRGKHKPIYTPHMETGDFVVVVNAEKVRITGNKLQQKVYHRHSGYPGGLKTEVLGKVMSRKPTFALEHAIKGMLPSGKMGRKIFKNLKIYAGAEHPHGAQKPEKLEL